MKSALIYILLMSSAAAALPVVGGKPVDNAIVLKTFGVKITDYLGVDTPPIPIGPRIAITCGHCAPKGSIFPAEMKSGATTTNDLYENRKPGTYGLSFLKEASYPFDLAVIILDPNDYYSGPFMTVAKERVRAQEKLLVLGMGKNTSSSDALCEGYDPGHKFAYNTFQVVDFYAQDVGFIVTGKGMGLSAENAVTCFGDSGGYYFRLTPNKSVELVGINSWGTENGIKEQHVDGEVNFQGFFSGAGDLTSPKIRLWLTNLATENKIEICGINKVCPSIPWPF